MLPATNGRETIERAVTSGSLRYFSNTFEPIKYHSFYLFIILNLLSSDLENIERILKIKISI